MSLRSDLRLPTPEKRFFPVIKVDLEARFMLPSGAESRCRVIEMSTAGIIFRSAAHPRIGEKIIVYISELGRFEGTVDRSELDSFSIGLKLTELKHKKLAEQLVWFSNRDELELPENRRHRRIVPLIQRVIVKMPDGSEKLGKIIDISLASVNLELTARLKLGARFTVGKKPATVARVYDEGVVADFDEPFADGELNEFIHL